MRWYGMGIRCLFLLGFMYCIVIDVVYFFYLVSEVLGVRVGLVFF